jgi:hypothetical protein
MRRISFGRFSCAIALTARYAVIALTLLMACPPTYGQTYCDELDDGLLIHIGNRWGIVDGIANACTDVDADGDYYLDNSGSSGSRCWFTRFYPELAGASVGLPAGAVGFPLNLDVRWGVSPGTYSPKSSNLIDSSSPLINGDDAMQIGPDAYLPRPLVGQNVDMITGVPLVQEVDFELPFGGSVYRHVRTYSETPTIASHEWPLANEDQNFFTNDPGTLFWDWHGQG